MFESILCQVTEYDPDVLESLIGLAVEIAREGREGRRVGTRPRRTIPRQEPNRPRLRHHDEVVVTLDFFIRCVDHCRISRCLKAEVPQRKDLRQLPRSGLK